MSGIGQRSGGLDAVVALVDAVSRATIRGMPPVTRRSSTRRAPVVRRSVAEAGARTWPVDHDGDTAREVLSTLADVLLAAAEPA